MVMDTDELRKLLDAATPGPWAVDVTDPSDVVVWASPGPEQNDELVANIGHRVQQVQVAFDCDADNARLIALTPDLAAEVIRLRERDEAARKLAAAMRALDPRQTGFMESMNWDAYNAGQNACRTALAEWEAVQSEAATGGLGWEMKEQSND